MREIPPMLLILLLLWGGCLTPFARFCDTFRDVLAMGQGDAGRYLSALERAGATGFGGVQNFSDAFLHGVCPPEDYFYCALLGVNCMQSWHELFCGISGLF